MGPRGNANGPMGEYTRNLKWRYGTTAIVSSKLRAIKANKFFSQKVAVSEPLLCTRKSLAVLRFSSATTKSSHFGWLLTEGSTVFIFWPNSLALISLVKSEVTRVSQRSQQRHTSYFHRTVFDHVITTDTIFDWAIWSKYSIAQTLSMARSRLNLRH